MTLVDLVNFLQARALVLRSCSFAPDGEVAAFTCDPLEASGPVHLRVVEDDGSTVEVDPLEAFVNRKGGAKQ